MTNDLNKKIIFLPHQWTHVWPRQFFLKTQIKYFFGLIRKFADFIKHGRPKLNLKHTSP